MLTRVLFLFCGICLLNSAISELSEEDIERIFDDQTLTNDPNDGSVGEEEPPTGNVKEETEKIFNDQTVTSELGGRSDVEKEPPTENTLRDEIERLLDDQEVTNDFDERSIDDEVPTANDQDQILNLRDFATRNGNSLSQEKISFREDFPSEESSPQKLTLRFNDRQLNLRRVDLEFPVFGERDGETEELQIPSFQQRELNFYTDPKHNGAFSVKTTENDDGTYTRQLEGFLKLDGRDYFITPVVREVNEKEASSAEFGGREFEDFEDAKHEMHLLKRVKLNFRDSTENHLRESSLEKRATCRGKYYAEILPVVDYDFYVRWNRNLNAIKYYFAHVVLGVDLRYENIKARNWRIYVRMVGIHIMRSRTDSLERTLKKYSGSPRRRLVEEAALVSLERWAYQRYNKNPKFDHAMLFTGCEMISKDGTKGVAGFAPVGAICSRHRGKSYGASVNEAKGALGSVVIAAHELGHNLGASHDGSGNRCSARTNNIMSPSNGYSGNHNFQNIWHFSSCSISYFNSNCVRGKWSCLKNHATHYVSSTTWESIKNKHPGMVYNLDAQCKQYWGTKSGFCRNIKKPTCRNLWCKHPTRRGSCQSGGGYVMWAKGTYCGTNKWCIKGKCVYDPKAPRTNIASSNPSGTPSIPTSAGGSNGSTGGATNRPTNPAGSVSYSQCRPVFKYKGVIYMGTTNIGRGKQWCVLKNKKQGFYVNPSTVPRQKTESGKDCWRQTSYNGETVTGCLSRDNRGQPWCYVKSGGWENCQLNSREGVPYGLCRPLFTYKKILYYGTTDRDNKGSQWCYLKKKLNGKSWAVVNKATIPTRLTVKGEACGERLKKTDTKEYVYGCVSTPKAPKKPICLKAKGGIDACFINRGTDGPTSPNGPGPVPQVPTSGSTPSGRCGPKFNNANCGTGKTCSKEGWCAYPIVHALVCAFQAKSGKTPGLLAEHGNVLKKVMNDLKFNFHNKVEMAAFLAMVAQETGHLSTFTERCAQNKRHYKCPARYGTCSWYKGFQTLSPNNGKKYYGRGPLQLTYPCNYKKFEDDTGIKVYNNPDLVETNKYVMWRAAMWDWLLKDKWANEAIWRTSCSDYTTVGKFGMCIKKINGFEECNGVELEHRKGALQSRIRYYNEIRTQCLGLAPERNKRLLTC